MSKPLIGMKIAIIATDMVEESELIEPRAALEQAGAETELIAPKEGDIISANHFDKSVSYPVDATLEEIESDDYDAIYLPGGALNSDQLRTEPLLMRLIKQFDEAGKPIAMICHAVWEAIDAGIVTGRTLTSYDATATDAKNAGAEWVDEPVVVDDNLISSRKPDDIPKFNRALIEMLSQVHTFGGLKAM